MRQQVPALDEILGFKWPVLDDGFVRAVDYLGSDSAIVQAARVSYGAGTRAVHEDAGLIRYLMRHRHTTPFEMCELKLHVRVPMDTWRQWIRHRTASVNEYSTRYSIAIDAMSRTEPTQWRLQARDNRQGSEGNLQEKVGRALSANERAVQEAARAAYEDRLAAGVAREQARKDLPLSTYTEAFWKMDLHNLLHFLALRMDSHAQHEIREYARVIGEEIVRRWCPLTWEAFRDYVLNSVTLTAPELELVRRLHLGTTDAALEWARSCGWLGAEGTQLPASRERVEAEQKLRQLGIAVPWKE